MTSRKVTHEQHIHGEPREPENTAVRSFRTKAEAPFAFWAAAKATGSIKISRSHTHTHTMN